MSVSLKLTVRPKLPPNRERIIKIQNRFFRSFMRPLKIGLAPKGNCLVFQPSIFGCDLLECMSVSATLDDLFPKCVDVGNSGGPKNISNQHPFLGWDILEMTSRIYDLNKILSLIVKARAWDWQTHPFFATFTKIAPGKSLDFLPLQSLNQEWHAYLGGRCSRQLRERKVHGSDFWVENSAKMQLQKGRSDVL